MSRHDRKQLQQKQETYHPPQCPLCLGSSASGHATGCYNAKESPVNWLGGDELKRRLLGTKPVSKGVMV